MRVAASIRVEAAMVLPSLAAALSALDHQSAAVRAWATGALVRSKVDVDRIVPALEKALHDPVDQVRIAAAQALGRVGSRAIDAAATLVDSTNRHSGRMRAAAMLALGRMGPLAIPYLIEALSREREDVRRWAIVALNAQLEKIKGSAATIGVIAALRTALSDDDTLVRIRAAGGLGLLGMDAVDTLDELEVALGDSSARVAHAARWAIDRIRAA